MSREKVLLTQLMQGLLQLFTLLRTHKAWILRVGRWLLAGLLIASLLRVGDWSLIRDLRHADLAWVSLGAILTGLMALIASVKWQRILGCISSVMPNLMRMFVVTTTGMAAGLVLPQELGGFVVKSAWLWEDEDVSRSRGLVSIFIDRVVDLLLVVIMTLPMIGVLAGCISQPQASAMAVTLVVLLAGSASASSTLLRGSIFPSLLHKLIGTLSQVRQFSSYSILLERLAAQEVQWDVESFLVIYTLAVARLAVLIGRAYVLGLAVSVEVPFGWLVLVVPLVQMTAVVPITPAGLGVAEFSWYAVLQLIGINNAQAMLFVISQRIFDFLSVLLVALLAVLVGRVFSPTRVLTSTTKHREET